MNIEIKYSKPFSFLIVPALSILFLLFAVISTGIRSDHLFLIALVNLCYFISSFTRRLITGLGIFIVYWIIYDSMKAWPNWAYHEVDILPLYNLEKSLFGIHHDNTTLTPNEFLTNHYTTFLDIMCGFFYLSWVPLPLYFAFYLYSKNKNLFLRFSMVFFVVNMLGFIIYYIHPAAPPWYFEKYGSVLDVSTKSNAAGLLRFDHYFGIHFFQGLYEKGSNVFAAMPSLHASYPLIGLIYAYKQPSIWLRIVFAVVMVGIWFSAVYLNHHYILDILAGIGCGLSGVLIFEKILMKTKAFGEFMKKYEAKISKHD